MAEFSLARSAQQPPELVECFRHECDGCPRCDGSGYRPRKRCAGCAKAAKALQAARGAKSWEEARTLLLYCADCNPRFAGPRLDAAKRSPYWWH